MSDETSIQVHFGRPMPVFPLDVVACMPQQVVPLHVFEPRYKQMIERSLDGPGQIAMAVFEGPRWKQEYHGRPPIKNAVCIGQIIQHERLPDGRYNVLLQGVCRAKVVRELPAAEGRLYRAAVLEPLGVPGAEDDQLMGFREKLTDWLTAWPLTQLAAAEWVAERARNEEIPLSALLELASFTLLTASDVRYALLAEPDAAKRVKRLEGELHNIGALIQKAARQRPERWPKGCSWN